MDLIIYHNNCPDGWCAAFICKTKYPEAELMGLNHGLLPEALEELFRYATGKNVIMVDYSLRTRELNNRLNVVAKSFRILDHHKTAQAALADAPYAIFDMKRSGAGLAWDYLFGFDSGVTCDICHHNEADGHHEGHRPWWVNYTEDQDLWNWVLPGSQTINAYLVVQPRTVEKWKEIISMSMGSAANSGEGVRSYIEYYTRSVIAEAQKGVLIFEGIKYRTAVLNIPYVGVSEAGNALCKDGYPIALLWFERGDGVIQFSLRGDGTVDVSAIAKSFGGGGHNNAAGFQTSVEEGRKVIDAVLGRKEEIEVHEHTPRCC